MNVIKVNPLYKVQEEGTNGWGDVCEPCTKKECKVHYDSLLREGVNPQRLKIVRVQ
jgi:hypothetical protein